MSEINERLTELLMQSYDQGVADAKAIAEAVVNEVVAKAVESERAACTRVAGVALLGADKSLADRVVNAIRSRGHE